jgi:hypothetical protein
MEKVWALLRSWYLEQDKKKKSDPVKEVTRNDKRSRS